MKRLAFLLLLGVVAGACWATTWIARSAPPDYRPPIGALPVYRFWNTRTKAHFYTISERERDKLINEYSNIWIYEGVAWYGYAPFGDE